MLTRIDLKLIDQCGGNVPPKRLVVGKGKTRDENYFCPLLRQDRVSWWARSIIPRVCSRLKPPRGMYSVSEKHASSPWPGTSSLRSFSRGGCVRVSRLIPLWMYNAVSAPSCWHALLCINTKEWVQLTLRTNWLIGGLCIYIPNNLSYATSTISSLTTALYTNNAPHSVSVRLLMFTRFCFTWRNNNFICSSGSSVWHSEGRHRNRGDVRHEARADHEIHYSCYHGGYHCHLWPRSGRPHLRFSWKNWIQAVYVRISLKDMKPISCPYLN